ncbi:helix-turn-helix domain-containing protein [Agarivorans sp. MS3-6]
MEKRTVTNNESLLCTLHSNDANHQAANLINWQQEFDQLSQGQFLGVINEVSLPHIHVFREDTSHELRQQCRVEDGGLWLGVSANNKSCRINHQRTSHDQFLCMPGGLDFELLTPDNFSIFGLVLPKSLLTQFAEQNEEAQISQTPRGLCIEGSGAGAQMVFRQYLSLLLQPQGHRWSSITQEIILQDAVQELLSQAQQVSASHVGSHQRLRIMKRVKHYLSDSRLKTPVTISEICAAVHVSRRTLQYTFSECLGMSPKQYIKIIRLNQVRRRLLNCDSARTISEIAFDYGFFHLSQFSQDYMRLFGEKPRQTLQHNHRYRSEST